MSVGSRRWPAWLVALAISGSGGALCVLFYFVIPELGIHGLPAGEGSVRLLAPLTLVFATIFYVGLADDKPRNSSRLRLACAGGVGGIAFIFVLHALPSMAPISFPVIALGATVGAALAVVGVFGFLARGL